MKVNKVQILGFKTHSHHRPSVDILVINEQQQKDYIRGEKRICMEMRPEAPFASVRIFSEPSKSDFCTEVACSLYLHAMWINFTINM